MASGMGKDAHWLKLPEIPTEPMFPKLHTMIQGSLASDLMLLIYENKEDGCGSTGLDYAVASLETLKLFPSSKYFSVSAYSLVLWNIPLGTIKKVGRMVETAAAQLTLFPKKTVPQSQKDLMSQDEFKENQMAAKVTTLLSFTKGVTYLDIYVEDFVLGKCDIRRLPSNFDQLLTLKGRGLCKLGSSKSLLTYIFRRAPNLTLLRLFVWWSEEDTGISALSQLPALLYEPKRQVLPHVSLNVRLTYIDAGVLQDLFKRGFNQIAELEVELKFDQDETRTNELLRSFNSFLELQKHSLKKLSVIVLQKQNRSRSDPRLIIPPLDELLWLRLLHREDAPVFQPFVPGQFPALRGLQLFRYDACGCGGNCFDQLFSSSVVIPTLEFLEILNLRGCRTGLTFHINFPNLKNMGTEVLPSPEIVEYILTKLTYLEGLNLGTGSAFNNYAEEKFWDLYTGGLPLPIPDPETGEMPDLENMNVTTASSGGGGIPGEGESEAQRHPLRASLANLTKLKRLSICISTPLEHRALLLMSRPGRLPKLDLLRVLLCHPTPRRAREAEPMYTNSNSGLGVRTQNRLENPVQRHGMFETPTFKVYDKNNEKCKILGQYHHHFECQPSPH